MSGILYINNTTDAAATNDTGALIIGNKAGENIAIDSNEVMARNNKTASTLYLNNDGGLVSVGSGGLTTTGKLESTWLRVVNNSSNNSDDAMVYLENKSTGDWAQKIVKDTNAYGLNIQGSGNYLLQVGTATPTLRVDTGNITINGASINMSKAGEVGVEVDNTQSTNPNKVAFIVGSSGNGGIYSRKHTKWIVYSDASGNVVLNGNANTASKLATARTITLSGSVTGSATFDGSANITINTTTNHNHDSAYKKIQTAVSSPSASNSEISFIDTISQDTQGVITATKKTVRDASFSQSGILSTSKQSIAGQKTIRYSTRIYPIVGASAEHSQWYKITFPYYNAETTSSAKWFMNSFDLHFGGGYSANSSGVIHVVFYWTRAKENGVWSATQVSAQANGIYTNKIILYYRIAEPGILYVNNTSNQYNGLWLDNLFVDDTSPSLDWSTTKIETCAAITASTTPALIDYTIVPQANWYTENGTSLKTNVNIEGQYIKGTWLYTSAATAQTTPTKIATIHTDNYIYYSTPANVVKAGVGTSSIGGTSTPIYWNGSSFVAGTSYANSSVGTAGYATTASQATHAATADTAGTATFANSALEFSSNATVTLTGDTTGTSNGSKKSWSVETTTKLFSGTVEAAPALVTSPGAGKIRYSYNVNTGTTGLFANNNNANSILTLNRHNGNYNSQLGFSSSGGLYYRSFNGSALDNTTPWKQIAFTDSNITGKANTAGTADYAITAGSANAVAWGNVSGKPSTFAPSAHDHSQIVTAGDNRNVSTIPNNYSNKIIFQGLKGKASINNPSTDTYSYLVGLRGWSDSSGGDSHEIAFNNTGLYWRTGATTAWNAWNRIVTNSGSWSITAATATEATHAATAASAAQWTTARTLTIGDKGQSVDGSANVSWTMKDMHVSPQFNAGDTGNCTYILVTLNKETSWMYNFTLKVYSSYIATDFQISGYNYGSSHWYSPQARVLASTTTGNCKVYFGYTANYKLWVAVDGGNYSGACVSDLTNGYTQADFENAVTITKVSALPGTTQTTVNCYRPWYRDETVSSATYAASAGAVAWGNVTGKPDSYYSLPLAATGTRGGVKVGYTASGKNYAVQLSNEQMYVNVPWTDTWIALSTSTAGYVAKAPNDTSKYLRGDGTWATVTIPTLDSLGIGNVKNYDQSKAIKGITRSGTTFTYTCLDGTTGSFTQQDNNTTYNFSGTTFYSGSSATAEHAANNAVKNGNYYYSSNGPASTLGAQSTDGALYVQSYSDSWVGQIGQDYRDGQLFVRSKNNGTWKDWQAIPMFTTTTGGVGDTTQPVYINTSGQLVAGTSYANATVGTAGYATTASQATHAATANSATTASEATHAATANSATTATEATHAATANSATTAGWAMKANSSQLTDIALTWSSSYATGSWMLIHNGETGTNGGQLFRAINQANVANWVDAQHKWVRIGGDTVTGTINRTNQGSSWIGSRDLTKTIIATDASSSTSSTAFSLASIKFQDKTYALSSERAGNQFGLYGWLNSRTENGFDYAFYIANDTYWHTNTRIYGAVWNDYAEKRNIPEAQNNNWKDEECKSNPLAGYCVVENGDDTMSLSTMRLQKGCKIISDTFGFSIGETETAKTPVAVSGRVLAYLYEGREEAKKHIGDFVCSGPNGTISIMTTEEYLKYPQAALGTISAIPDYEEWGINKIKVNGRIWIYVK